MCLTLPNSLPQSSVQCGEIMSVRGLGARKHNKTFPRQIIIAIAMAVTARTHIQPRVSRPFKHPAKLLLRASFVSS